MEQNTNRLFQGLDEPFGGFARTATAERNYSAFSGAASAPAYAEPERENARAAAHNQLYSNREKTKGAELADADSARNSFYERPPEPQYRTNPQYQEQAYATPQSVLFPHIAGNDEPITPQYNQYDNTYFGGGTTYQQRSQAQPYTTAAPVTAPSKPYSEAELQPSQNTMQYAEQAVEPQKVVIPTITPKRVSASAQKAEAGKFVLTKKVKLTVAIYASVIVLLIALVAVTGVIISSISDSSAALQISIGQKNAEIIGKEEALADIDSAAAVKDKAEELGMVPEGIPVSIKLLPLTPEQEYTEVTGWFDRFCDWFSNIFGG